MAQINLPTIKWGKKKTRSQMCEIFTDDGRIQDQELDVVKSCVHDPDKGLGFLLDSDDQLVGEDGQWYQVLYERSAIPVCMVGGANITEEKLPEIINQIYDESQKAAKEEQYMKASKNNTMDKLMVIVAIVCASALIMFGIQYFGKG